MFCYSNSISENIDAKNISKCFKREFFCLIQDVGNMSVFCMFLIYQQSLSSGVWSFV